MSKKLKLALLIINTAILAWIIWSYIVHGSVLALAVTPINLLVYTLRKRYPYLSGFLLLVAVVGALLVTYPPNLSYFTEPIAPIKPPVNATQP